MKFRVKKGNLVVNKVYCLRELMGIVITNMSRKHYVILYFTNMSRKHYVKYKISKDYKLHSLQPRIVYSFVPRLSKELKVLDSSDDWTRRVEDHPKKKKENVPYEETVVKILRLPLFLRFTIVRHWSFGFYVTNDHPR